MSNSFLFLKGLEVRTSLFCGFLLRPLAGRTHFGNGEMSSHESSLLELAAASKPQPSGPWLPAGGEGDLLEPAEGLPCSDFLWNIDRCIYKRDEIRRKIKNIQA